MTPKRSIPGRKLVVYLIQTLRFLIVFYVAGLSIASIVISGITMNVGGIIASIYLIPAAFILLALELGYLSSRAGALKHMQPLRIIGLQFVSAMITGVSWQSIDFFIACCVAFGMSIGLMNIVAVYYILWGRHAQEDGLYTWREGSATSSSSEGGIIFDTKDGEDSVLLIRNGSESDVESMRTSQSSLLYGVPTIVSVD